VCVCVCVCVVRLLTSVIFSCVYEYVHIRAMHCMKTTNTHTQVFLDDGTDICMLHWVVASTTMVWYSVV
jgi:hypothetical protein